MSESSISTKQRMTTHLRKELPARVLTVCIAMIVGLVAGELIGVGHFLRTIVQGRSFWSFTIVFWAALGLMLGVTFKKPAKSPGTSFTKTLALGTTFGFIGSIIAISGSPLLLGNGLSPAIYAWRHPSHLFLAAFLAMGWLYGGIAAFTLHFIDGGRLRPIGILTFACFGIRLLEMLAEARFIHH
jgi:hypothetical protein